MTVTEQRPHIQQTSPAEQTCAMLTPGLLDFVDRAHASLLAAACAPTATQRYLQAQEGAVRAAAALLTRRAPRCGGDRPRSVWEVVEKKAPEFAEAAEFFSTTARRSRAAYAGLVQVTSREADDLVREVESFLEQILLALGLPAMPPIGGLLPAVAR